MLKDHKCIVFAIDHYNPLGIARSLGRGGISPDAILVKGKAQLTSKSKYVSKTYEVSSVEEGYNVLLKEYGNYPTDCKPLIYCSDDKTIGYLDLHYNEIKDKFILFNAGAQGRINEYMNKFNILKCAEKNGLKTLKARVCKHGEIPKDLEYPVITKAISPNVGGWKSDVHICYSSSELKDAYESIKAEAVLLQKYIDKKNEYCLEGFSINKGQTMCITIASTYNYLITGYYSPYMTVRNMENATIRKGLQGMFSDIGFEGIFEAEFLIDQNDEIYFSEINFRNSTWSWASTIAGMNIPIIWGESMLSGKLPDNLYKTVPNNFIGMVEPIDYGKRVDTGKITAAEWLADFKNADVTYYYDKDDLEPYYTMMRNWERLK